MGMAWHGKAWHSMGFLDWTSSSGLRIHGSSILVVTFFSIPSHLVLLFFVFFLVKSSFALPCQVVGKRMYLSSYLPAGEGDEGCCDEVLRIKCRDAREVKEGRECEGEIG